MDDVQVEAESIIKVERVKEDPNNELEINQWNLFESSTFGVSVKEDHLDEDEVHPRLSLPLPELKEEVEEIKQQMEDPFESCYEEPSDDSLMQEESSFYPVAVPTPTDTSSAIKDDLEDLSVNYVCICQRRVYSRKKAHPNNSAPPAGKPSQCPICTNDDSAKARVVCLMRNHTIHGCTSCEKKFAERAQLISHMQVHTKERRECPFCKKFYVSQMDFEEHIRTHTGERPYECCLCKKTFMEKGSMIRHMWIHQKKKSFQCSKCDKSFAQEWAFMKHFIKAHTHL